jgi:hypothetical protein
LRRWRDRRQSAIWRPGTEALICRGSYRGVIEFMRDLLGISISVGTVHTVLQSAALRAGVINHEQDLSGIPVGLHDEIIRARCGHMVISLR